MCVEFVDKIVDVCSFKAAALAIKRNESQFCFCNIENE